MKRFVVLCLMIVSLLFISGCNISNPSLNNSGNGTTENGGSGTTENGGSGTTENGDNGTTNEETCKHIWDDGIEVESGTDAYLMEYTCTICGEKDQQIITIIPPNNDILDVSSYPQDFEYNGKHYHLVQGDGLKTTATQEELGELLGYIIREEDVSAFTQEYPSVDYVIDNGIYDYYENNRVAFYSLNAYPDLSIVCMYQLGEYVLYQSETIS